MTSSGTSPRTRGKRWITTSPSNHLRNIPAHAGKTRRRPPRHRGWRRNIPAHAGKTASGCCAGFVSWEHPRARGENSTMISVSISPQGTFPRTRGKRDHGRAGRVRKRNIPAHAGKTSARGKNVVSRLGTSPRTRGKLFSLDKNKTANRNIPAHAGKTAPVTALERGHKEHPRARGENS